MTDSLYALQTHKAINDRWVNLLNAQKTANKVQDEDAEAIVRRMLGKIRGKKNERI